MRTDARGRTLQSARAADLEEYRRLRALVDDPEAHVYPGVRRLVFAACLAPLTLTIPIMVLVIGSPAVVFRGSELSPLVSNLALAELALFLLCFLTLVPAERALGHVYLRHIRRRIGMGP